MSLYKALRKLFYKTIMLKGKFLPSRKDSLYNTLGSKPITNFYDLPAVADKGQDFDFRQFRGKKIVIVNTASTCGYAPQFYELEILHKQNKDKVAVIAFPTHDFKQERAEDVSITQFCLNNYGVTFPFMKKGSVVNAQQQAVYQWLSSAAKNGWCNHAPTWNFCKYIIDETGTLTHYFSQYISPFNQEFIAAIKK